ncbi:MAG TPA: TfoX/Sxy family protein [Accumulibacter sp.]|uniref:TfoX/Sxy family protein n=1 Tax=Accumulibacter sp. TaxID=2053492 RepID=UPI0025F395A9|nr:TfoX/Sxy family protein [Accumulibacter sp.]MCM8597179.1 TfoX/Sxy family protein [Accumulibacter sp.]MCM8661560.1 TfoX/Sxy family protein [Accumulibacter sp.]HNC52069.1 TfoX/Sxy family protein [Accumulibacter sp.]
MKTLIATATSDPNSGQVTDAVASQIERLPNLGPKSSAMLARASIRSLDELREIGAVAAYARVKRVDRTASLNLLWALQGALTGEPWQKVAREQRSSLLLALEVETKGP